MPNDFLAKKEQLFFYEDLLPIAASIKKGLPVLKSNIVICPIVFSKKIEKKNFDPENMKKTPSKVAHNRRPIFFMYWPGCPNSPETEIPYHQKPLNAGLGI